MSIIIRSFDYELGKGRGLFSYARLWRTSSSGLGGKGHVSPLSSDQTQQRIFRTMILSIPLIVLLLGIPILLLWIYLPDWKVNLSMITSGILWFLMSLIISFFTQNRWFSWLVSLPDPLARLGLIFYGWSGYLVLSIGIGIGLGWGVVQALPRGIPSLGKLAISAGLAIGLGALSFNHWRLDPGVSTVYAHRAARAGDLQQARDIQLEVMERFEMDSEAEALRKRGAQFGWQPPENLPSESMN